MYAIIRRIIIINSCYPLWDTGRQQNVAIWSYLRPDYQTHLQEKYKICMVILKVLITSVGSDVIAQTMASQTVVRVQQLLTGTQLV